MEPCEEIKQIVLKEYEQERSGRILDVVRNTYSRQAGVTVIGSDPGEWFEGYQAVEAFYTAAEGSQLEIQVDRIQAYCEGTVGWSADQVRLKLPNGTELLVRHIKIFHREEDGWKIVLNQVALPIPNEQVGA